MINGDSSIPIRYKIELAPSHYDLIKSGHKEFSYATADHLPKEPRTPKDNARNLANSLKDIKLGDSIIFACDPVKLKSMLFYKQPLYIDDLEGKVKEVREDKANHQRTIVFELVRTC